MEKTSIKLVKICERPNDHRVRLARAFRAVSKCTQSAKKGAKVVVPLAPRDAGPDQRPAS